ncbi:MAG TPA: DNA methyltransferase [Pyrinomonadaceae bacterium]|jgi:site-specific DNA-methyltransferase (cytosine-N4-specific)
MTLLEKSIFTANGGTTNLTHSFHPYPAKFPPQIPHNLLKQFSQAGDTVLDPFCGSGTTLVEARLAGINAAGVDVNPLSCLLAKVKATPLNYSQLAQVESFLSEIEAELFYRRMGKGFKIVEVPFIEGLAHWFQENVAQELAYLKQKIWTIADEETRDFLKIIFSSIIVRVSNQESDTRFAAINKQIPDGYTLKSFSEKAKDFLKGMRAFSSVADKSSLARTYNHDARDLSFLDSDSFDLVITSPPYANTYDYYLYHKFRKRWLELDVGFAQYNEIGSRREFSSLKRSPEKWTEDLKSCLSEISRVLKKGKYAFIVIGDSVINKNLIRADNLVSQVAKEANFDVVDCLSSDLQNHSRLFNPKFAQKGKKEHLIWLCKKY